MEEKQRGNLWTLCVNVFVPTVYTTQWDVGKTYFNILVHYVRGTYFILIYIYNSLHGTMRDTTTQASMCKQA